MEDLNGKLQEQNFRNEKLKVENEKLQELLREAQAHRKALFDWVFVNGDYSQGSSPLDSLVQKIGEVQVKMAAESTLKYQQVLDERNSEIKSLMDKYNKLARDHMKSLADYQAKLDKLEQENLGLKQSLKYRVDINAKFQEFRNYKLDELEIENNTLLERLDIVLERLKIKQEVEKNLKTKLQELQRKLDLADCTSLQNVNIKTDLGVDEFTNIIKENNILKK